MARIGLAIGGVLSVVGGAGLLVASSHGASRLDRLAGILIVLGVVAMVVAVVGRL